MFENLKKQIEIIEVGPRDGLQNEKVCISLDDKIKFISLLDKAGFDRIEATSFVKASSIPQMSDADKLYKAIASDINANLYCLIPNEKGLQRAMTCNVKNISLFTATSEKFSLKNTNMTLKESFKQIKKIKEKTKDNLNIRCYISTVFGCPYDNLISIKNSEAIIKDIYQLGISDISLGDTIGVATPLAVNRLIDNIKSEISISSITMHFHNTYAMALANILVALENGIYKFDSSAGGLGGCPYARGASGNVATEELVYMFESMNIKTGIDLDKLLKATDFILNCLNKPSLSNLVNLKLKKI